MIDIKNILSSAIKAKNDAHDYFNDLAKKENSANIRVLFDELTQEELEHRDILKSIEECEIDKYQFNADQHINEQYFNGQEYDNCSNIKEIITLFIEQLKDSHTFYLQLSMAAPSAYLRNTYENLANIELAFSYRLKNYLENS